MAAESLQKIGLYFDDLNKIRVLDPEASQKTTALKEECREYESKITEFQRVVDGFLQIAESLSAEVEKEKLKAIGSRNLLKSITKQREAQQQQLQALIIEKKLQLERLKVQHESLKKEEMEQNELIEQFLLQK
ncbi:intraflagellar transport protein 20 homolog [Argiope bruennichi]|uniref:Intraflagellar transport protein 20 like protein n=1 Tax=Argiope bruennichi TaxID=94029 RepID=A0A8T0FWV8_ARGBR|nr:intraflagellar transport protein 20 homolog [Argiope bruennichi]KAF8794745.1 Intraflagellar transport protein 20 like protein [Argiope bruennichi]